MIVRFLGANLHLSDELYDFVMDKLKGCIRTLERFNRSPYQVDVELEKIAPSGSHDGDDEPLYRAEVNVTVRGRLLRAQATAGELIQAVVKMNSRLGGEIHDWTARLRDEQGKERSEADALPNGARSADCGGEEVAAPNVGGIGSSDPAISG